MNRYVSFLLLLLLGAIDVVEAQCCVGVGPTLPANNASTCVNSTTGSSSATVPASWTLLPATSCASAGSGNGVSCMAVKCTVSSMGISYTYYVQQCATPSMMAASAQAGQSSAASSGLSLTCTIMSSDSPTAHPRILVLLLLSAVSVVLMLL